MDELRKNHILHIFCKNDMEIEGIVIDFEPDRVMVKINDEHVENAKKLNELDDIKVNVKTHFGLKTMDSCVISALNRHNCLVIENAPSHQVEQKREHVRINVNFDFFIVKNEKFIKCKCENISAGGIAFVCEKDRFNLNEEIKIVLPSEEFTKQIKCGVKIVKELGIGSYAGQFFDLNQHDENKIVKRIFEVITLNKDM